MSDYTRQLITDLPEQFKGKLRIEALMGAVGHQFDNVYKFYEDLNVMRSLDTAEGVQLDMIGTIVDMTRKDAFAILQPDADELSDDLYRLVLKYKILLNNSNATYKDIMRAVDLMMGGLGIYYSEEVQHPATIILSLPLRDIDDWPSFNRILMVKAAGVGILWRDYFWIIIDHSELEQFILQFIEFRMKIPFWRCRTWDGSFLLDGEYLLDAARDYNLVPTIYLRTSLDHSEVEDVGNITITTQSVDCLFLNGAVNLDGSRNLDSIYREETITDGR